MAINQQFRRGGGKCHANSADCLKPRDNMPTLPFPTGGDSIEDEKLIGKVSLVINRPRNW